jgi:hypothetical protein
MALVTPEQFATWYQRTLTPAQEAAVAMMLDAVSGEVTDYCGWHIAPVITEEVTVDGSGGHVQHLPTLKLLDLIAVAESGTVLDVAGVQWSEGGWMRRTCRWTCDLRGVEAEIEHGYAQTPPALVALICGAVARAIANPAGVVQERSGGESVTYSYADRGTRSLLADGELRILDRKYRIPLRA